MSEVELVSIESFLMTAVSGIREFGEMDFIGRN